MTIHPKTALSRRRVLRAAGVAVTLPFMPSLVPRAARAAAPKRLVLWFQPDGIMEPSKLGFEGWWPSGSETAFTLPAHNKPLEGLKGDLVFLRGIHNSSSTTEMLDSLHGTMLKHMLTGGGPDSIDQVIADRVGAGTRFKSLELGVATSSSGRTDTRMVYKNNAALTPEPDPNRVFARLFGGTLGEGGAAPGPAPASPDTFARLQQRRKSVLDGVLQELSAVRARLGADDVKRLDEHTTAIRDIERTLSTTAPTSPAAGPVSCGSPNVDGSSLKGQTAFANVIPNMHKVAAVQHDLLLLALRCDLTRVVTMMFMRGRADTQPYDFLPLTERSKGQHAFAHSWHSTSKSPNGARDYAQVHVWRAELFRDLVSKMKAIPDGDGATLFDNTLVAWISEMGDGSHNHRFLPWVLSGRAGGQLRTGRRLTFDGPHTNALLSIAALMGVPLTRFGRDGTSPLAL